MAEVGYFSLILALVVGIYGINAFLLGVRKENHILLSSAKNASLAVALLCTVATGIMVFYLMTGEYTIKYVYSYTSNDLPAFYRFAALWAGNAGSLLLWLLLLVWYTVIVAFSKRTQHLTPYASSILLLNSAFFLFVLAFLANPFERVSGWFPGASLADGAGMNPMLQNPGMVFHPVTTYLGYVGFAVPFAYAMAALITRNSDDQWIRVTRRWTITAWLFLTLGNLWGAQWAYVELGWGGYWGWDPVENASFIPWLTGSAFLHSVMIQERKNMLKVWNVSLISITYVLTLFGTFLVRSGVLTSVHAFGSGPLGRYFLVFTVSMFCLAGVLIIFRYDLLTQDHTFESFLSKESSFLLNNLGLVGMAFAVYFGTIYPLVSEAVRGVKVSVGAPYFNSVIAPLGIVLFLLMGICPLIAWRKASWRNLVKNFLWPAFGALLVVIILFANGEQRIYPLLGYATAFFTIATILLEFIRGTRVRHRITKESYPLAFIRLLLRNRRRHGGYIIHLGLVIMLIGVIGSNSADIQLTKVVSFGESVEIGNYRIVYEGLYEKQNRTKDIVYANLLISDKESGKLLGRLEPQKVFYSKSEQPSTEVGLRSTLKEDLYIILSAWEKDGTATFKFYVNPLVAWIWIGGYILVMGTIFALWPGRGSQAGSKYLSRASSPTTTYLGEGGQTS